jgi:hypothetical protein
LELTQVEMSIHVGEWESGHVFALVLLLVGEVGVVLGCIRIEDVQALEFVLHFSFDLAQAHQPWLVTTCFGINHVNFFVVFFFND